jgi:hypothetical protein
MNDDDVHVRQIKMLKEQMHRMNYRIDEASERWTKEKRALEIEIEDWRAAS